MTDATAVARLLRFGHKEAMLNENDVVAALCRHLELQGYQIVQRLSIRQKGVDIIAKQPNQLGRLLIEAKGGTTAREGSARSGKDFKSSQVSTRIARAFYTAARMHGMYCKGGDTIGLACPDTRKFREYLEPIKGILDGLGITVFLVKQDRSVIRF